MAYETPTAAQEALERQGYTHNPYESFDPWLFAPEGQTPELLQQQTATGLEALAASQAATSEAGQANRAMSRYMLGNTPQKAVRNAWHNTRAGGGPSPAERINIPRGTQAAPDLVAQQQAMGRSMVPDRPANIQGYVQPEHLRVGGARGQDLLRKKARDASTAANLANMQAMERSQRDYGLAALANWDDQSRQRYSQDLQAMGITPFELQRQAKQSSIWGL